MVPLLQEFFVEFSVDDADRSLAFYGNVFNWASVSIEGPIEYHLMGEADGATVASVMPTVFAPQTLVYFPAKNLDATLERVRKYDGRVILSQPIEGLGSVAQCKDPQGNRFGLTDVAGDAPLTRISSDKVSWRPSRQRDAMDVRAIHVDIAVEDGESALDFYRNVFGWVSAPVRGALPYHNAGEAEGPAMVSIIPVAPAPRTFPYFRTDDVKGTAERIWRHGGRVVRARPQEGVGTVAQCKDPDGNAFGLIELAGDAPLLRMTADRVSDK